MFHGSKFVVSYSHVSSVAQSLISYNIQPGKHDASLIVAQKQFAQGCTLLFGHFRLIDLFY